VLAVLRGAAEPLCVSAISTATRLSANAVRFHLDNLIDVGAVRGVRDPDHSGAGRPAVLYSAMPSEAVDPAAAYRVLAGLLARELTRSGGPKASTDAGRVWARRIVPDRVGDAADPLAVVVSLFEDTGFNPTIGADGSTVELHRCPFRELAIEQPEVVCGVHLGLLTGVLEEIGAPTKVRLVPVLDGSGPCLVLLSKTSQARVSTR
jgi:predicted ArsR family transcriptional regulator